MKHSWALLGSMLIISGFLLAAQTVEVNAVENENLSSEKTVALSEFIVSGCLDALFDSGYIGTNKRPLAGTKADFDAFSPGWESVEGFIDYHLVLFLEYSAAELLLPPNIIFKLVSVDGGRIMGEGNLKHVVPASKGEADTQSACEEMGKRLVLATLLWLKE